MRWKSLLLFLSSGISLCLGARPLEIGLEAVFSKPSYLALFAETLHAESPEAFYWFLNSVSDRPLESSSPKAAYDDLLIRLQNENVLDDETLSSFQFALALSSGAPKLAAFHSLVDEKNVECNSWILGRDGPSCKVPTSFSSIPKINVYEKNNLDYVYDDCSVETPTVIAVTDFGVEFAGFHKQLMPLAESCKIRYVIRYSPSPKTTEEPLRVAGFGAHASLKRTDYLVVDDREVKISSQEAGSVSTDNEQKLFADLDDNLEAVPEEQLEQLGSLTAQYISQQEDPLTVLRKLSQDFPLYAHKIAGEQLNKQFIENITAFQERIIPEGTNIVSFNGIPVDVNELDAFSLLSMLRSERAIVNDLKKLGLSPHEAQQVLCSDKFGRDSNEIVLPKFDYRDDTEGGNVIVWANDLENDPRYSEWPTEVQNFLRPLYPGQLHMVRKQLHTVIYPVDPSSSISAQFVRDLLMTTQRVIPIQTGMVCRASGDNVVGQVLCRAFHFLRNEADIDTALSFLLNCLQEDDKTDVWSLVEKHMPPLLRDDESLDSLHNILYSPFFDALMANSNSWMNRLSIDPHNRDIIVNGRIIDYGNDFHQNMLGIFIEDIPQVQTAVAMYKLTDDDDLLDFALSDALPKRNALVYPSSKNVQRNVNLQASLNSLGLTLNDVLLFGRKSAPITLWLITDFSAPEFGTFITTLEELQQDVSDISVVLLPNSNTTDSVSLQLVERVKARIAPRLSQLEDLYDLYQPEHKVKAETKELMEKYLKLVSIIGVSEHETGILMNGRLITPLSPDSLNVDDLAELAYIERNNFVEILEDLIKNPRVCLPFLSSYLKELKTRPFQAVGYGQTQMSFPRDSYVDKLKQHATFSYGDVETAMYSVVAIINPLSAEAQKLSVFLETLSKMNSVFIMVILNPQQKLEELPLKRYYRYSIASVPQFDEQGNMVPPSVIFDNLPADVLLTMDLETRDAWVVMQKDVQLDLYNVKLPHTESNENLTPLTATYELKNILVQGYSTERQSGRPPRGMQVLLSNKDGSYKTDTIVLANYGYFQLKGNPGIFTIAPKSGRSEEIFSIDGVNHGTTDNSLTISGFEGVILHPTVSRNPGYENEDVLKPDAPSHKFLNKLLRPFRGAQKDEHAEINIFSLASGHLYERFIYIMTRSVMEHTKHTVKFWFIENFLSPSFKRDIAILAEKYKFKYEFVTYNWPHWLRKQTEKQREIWGYKILFLDVLFPLDLEKVIFVDADQIVRADLKELMDLDLKGAPYAYTPMCDSRTEMEGFRFWKQGYWKKYLRGMKYHISALYVVDLDRFRHMGAGDLLRRQYQLLSADPESLSNLDQDLPNHLQRMIPIYSLPQEWLWCETWCSDESLKKAKTIDLCQNPLTKEKKLDRARRQVTEWTTYDDEIHDLLEHELHKEEARPESIRQPQQVLQLSQQSTQSNPSSNEGVDEL
ncbi:UDP-glucose-glycoprotein glucosyltransferase Gpt1 [Schizosaccharomyces japonicus yFS275]|uniref:UDP-glucose-glycoprotein glucosyltransferase Gpt1 n=1 Tax=Schizosaccharomyces japonicus (strain yFS275 / FY16936) TaxID=402676 RepID=B6K765_SCHJY|nr:UDP-glucose-glycoprotein glucosyltransferase Gpt1 [Schizosaccharomyces japonicus yFS275]EEB09369.1 UDP-glucose-glycoprotein glucosyltransferase Gpt1 [Schizosaccharomyces japonicus yFS275]